MIPALVLTAGLATRLRPLSSVRAKAALPVGGAPLAARVLQSLAAAGVGDAVLNLHHMPETIAGRIGDGTGLGIRVRYSWESPVLGSAGGPRRALPLLASPAFFILNGDTLTTVDLAALLDAHMRSGALVTMAVVPNHEPQKYGGVLADAGAVTGFVRRGDTRPSHHFTGVQVASAEAFTGVPPDVPYETVAALYPALIAARPGSVRVFETAAEFHDIGTPADYLRTAQHFAARERPPRAPLGAGTHARIDPSASLEGSVLWDDVTVGARARVHGCVVTDGVHLPDDTSFDAVTIRRASGTLEATERRVGDLAIAPL
jgi:NDP-sugar pyrophosphorylase family protein